jgi:hypothetical protein
MDDPKSKKEVSPQKLAANRLNAKRSTGPQTEAGKAKAAQNSYKHGFFALRLFPNDKLRAEDADNYNSVYSGLRSHYAPVCFMENFWLEKAATEALRIARVLGYGQKVLDWQMPFESPSVDRLLRYESTVTRNFAQAIKNLELLQAQRKAEATELDEPADPEPDTSTGEPEPTPNEPPSIPQEAVTEEPTLVGTSAQEAATHLTAEDSAANAKDKTEPTPTDAKPAPQPTETVQSPTPPPAAHETNPEFSNRWVETAEDQKLIDDYVEEIYGDVFH